jgi:hypothetical protein
MEVAASCSGGGRSLRQTVNASMSNRADRRWTSWLVQGSRFAHVPVPRVTHPLGPLDASQSTKVISALYRCQHSDPAQNRQDIVAGAFQPPFLLITPFEQTRPGLPFSIR